MAKDITMKFPIRGAIAFALPVLAVAVVTGFAVRAGHPQNYYFLAAAPLSGVIGSLAYGRRLGLPIVSGLCFGIAGILFALQEPGRSALIRDVVWVGLVSGVLFWSIGALAMLTLPPPLRFRGATAFAVPGAIAGLAFQFLYGPGHYMFDLNSRQWWGTAPWEQLVLWLIVGAGTGWLLGRHFETARKFESETSKSGSTNLWGMVSLVFGVLGLGIGMIYFLRSALPLGLFNSLSPASAASDWFWSWGVLTFVAGLIALTRATRRTRSAAGIGLAIALMFASYRVEANPWKTRFNTGYASKLLREHGQATDPRYGDVVYSANLILAQAALDENNIANARHYLLEAASTPGTQIIQQTSLDVSVARVLLQRGERDTVLEYLRRGHSIWPQGNALLNRWESAIRAGRPVNFNTRGPNAQDR